MANKKLLNSFPFILLIFYYFFIYKSQIASEYKMSALGAMILVSFWIYLKKGKNIKYSKNILPLALGASGVVMIIFYLMG